MTAPDRDGDSGYTGPPRQVHPPYGPAPYGPAPHGPAPYGPPWYGPPPYGPPPFGPPPYGPPPYGPPGYLPYGAPGWAPFPPPGRPQRPGTVIGAAVFAVASAVLVLLGTVYAAAFGALLSLARGPGTGMALWFALLQIALAGLLVVGAVRLLGGDRRWLLGAVVVDLGLCLYWFFTLDDLGLSTVQGTARAVAFLYAGLAVLAGALALLPDARAWARRPSAGEPGAGA